MKAKDIPRAMPRIKALHGPTLVIVPDSPSPRHNRYQQKRRHANQPPAFSSTQLNQSLHAPST
ncbi:hypothetical protein EKT70_03840 [Stenotrophomonas geniculata]|nr:hypothetical protein EKT70_03840 [Stenotrophomonas geniculata]